MKQLPSRVVIAGLLAWGVLTGYGNVAAQTPRQPTGTWQTIHSDDFETGNWPDSVWTVADLSNDGYDREWGHSNYYGFGGLWPAAGGADSIYPPSQYADNINTRMIYGPIDLSNASSAFVDFYLWREIESCCDLLAFEASHDGSSWQTVGQWSGSQDWEYESFQGQLDSYLGDNSVWIAWHFTSDYS
ncbi:MAG: hypothetical protein HY782_18940 [Chloroflexi bacterium]|nr:hypothetical protein [Chloroflexota bacterium]